MKIFWITLTFVAACIGVLAGSALRESQETGRGLFSSSELLALRGGDSTEDDSTSSFPSTAYYDQIRRILESQFVEQPLDDTKLARGSLRFLLRALADPESRYYEPDQWAAYLGRLKGVYVGIGADLIAQEKMTSAGLSLPVHVVSVAPGGPAEAAGLKTGDVIESVDGRWVASKSLFEELQRASDAFVDESITREEYDKIWQTIRDRAERMISVDEALETLQFGSGKVAVEYRRDGTVHTVEIERQVTTVTPVVSRGDTILIRTLGPGVAETVVDEIGDKKSVILDLRGNPGGSYDEVIEILGALAPAGVFGQVRTHPKANLEKLRTERGSDETRRIEVLVDRGTAREAELLAYGLRDLAGATVSGGPTAGLGRRVQRFALPDGSGYSLTSAHYFDAKGASLVREDEAAKKYRAEQEAKQ